MSESLKRALEAHLAAQKLNYQMRRRARIQAVKAWALSLIGLGGV